MAHHVSPDHTNEPHKTLFGFKEAINEVQIEPVSFSSKIFPLAFIGNLVLMTFSDIGARFLFENMRCWQS